MNLPDLLKMPEANLSFSVTGLALQEFGQSIAEATARKIISELNKPDVPITEKEVCKMLGKTRQTLAKYRKEGKLRYNRVGREIYYLPSKLQEDINKF